MVRKELPENLFSSDAASLDDSDDTKRTSVRFIASQKGYIQDNYYFNILYSKKPLELFGLFIRKLHF